MQITTISWDPDNPNMNYGVDAQVMIACSREEYKKLWELMQILRITSFDMKMKDDSVLLSFTDRRFRDFLVRWGYV